MDRDAIYCIAHRLADERFHCDFYQLSRERKAEVWHDAERLYSDCLADAAEQMRKGTLERNGK